MNKDSEEYESLRSKIMKLKALAERGDEGERDNATRLLRRLCAQAGLNLTDLDYNDKPQTARFNVGRAKAMLTLFAQSYMRVTGEVSMKYHKDGAIVTVIMTPLQAAQLDDLWNWHKAHFKSELKKFEDEFLNAYIVKHNLTPGKHTADSDKPLTKEDLARLRRELMMMAQMSDDVYLKAICNLKGGEK
jgi:hypothetical protein